MEQYLHHKSKLNQGVGGTCFLKRSSQIVPPDSHFDIVKNPPKHT
jgi:hypothetical protein